MDYEPVSLAEKFSKDPSAKNNRGDVGMITRDSPFVEDFKDAALRGTKGSIIGPVKTLYGYHIIKITDKKVGRVQGYDEVEMKVQAELKQDLVQKHLSGLKKQAKIQIDEAALGKM